MGGYPYTAIHTHPDGISANAAEIEVWNATGTSRIVPAPGAAAVTHTLSPAAADGETISIPEWHTDLAWETDYAWRMRVRDINNSWGNYSALKSFATNRRPSSPTLLSPTDNKTTESRTFSATATDPDGDAITAAQIEIVNADTGATVTGYPTAMSVGGSNGESLAHTAPASGTGSLTPHTNYKWRARANDGHPSGFGAWSGYEFFRFAPVPVVTLLTPDASRTNLTKQPSAEYDPATLLSYWTETARTAQDFIDRAADGGAAYGVAAWQGTASASGDYRFRDAGYEAVDATKPYLASCWMDKQSGTSASHFALACYDASNALLGTIYPQSIALANGVDVPTSWTEYGGIVWPIGSANTPAFPTGTAKVRREVTPSRNSGSPAVVRFDALTLEQLPVPATMTPAEWLAVQPFYGYGDPDVGGYGTPSSAGYAWTGDAGDSPSTIPHVLDAPAASVAISYSSSSALAKKDDRLRVEHWKNGAWEFAADTGYPLDGQGSARTIIPLPPGVVKNEGRYRLKVYARDANEGVGESDWIEFDVRFDGPGEPNILTSVADPVKAQLRVQITPWGGTAQEFAGIEVAREALDGSEPLEIVENNTDPKTTQIVYHYPRSGVPYRLKMRFVKVEGSTLVQGRWASVELTCDYSPYNFVKDVEDPGNLYAAYETEAGNLATVDKDREKHVSMPWGAEKPTIELRWGGRLKTGTVVAEFFPDALNQEPHEVRYEKMYEITERDRCICVMLQIPRKAKYFASITGPVQEGWRPTRIHTIAFTWTENSYAEDWYERNGVA